MEKTYTCIHCGKDVIYVIGTGGAYPIHKGPGGIYCNNWDKLSTYAETREPRPRIETRLIHHDGTVE